jgi:hypothetical protein
VIGSHQLHRHVSVLAIAAALAVCGARGILAQLQLAAPTSANPGQLVFIAVTPGASVQSAYVITEAPLPAVQSAATTNQFSLAIPAGVAPGIYHLTAVGISPNGLVESDPFAISIERPDDPVQILVDPTYLTFRTAGDQVPLRVVGLYADGTQARLTASARTAYSSLDATVAVVNATGIVTAVGPGQTKISIKTPKASLRVPAQVQAPPPSTLSLLNGRFQITVTYSTGTASGQGTPVQLTPDTGYFWFFAAANVEMMIKVLNGCSLGGHYWVFAGGLTNVQTSIVVTDTQAHLTKTYATPLGPAFTPIQDTSAFASCP